MVSILSGIRTSLAIGVAAGTVIAALAMSPRRTPRVPLNETPAADDGMRVSAATSRHRMLPSGGIEEIAVTITAPNAAGKALARPPVSLAIVIDRSGSMHGEPLENAKAAARSVLQQLSERDAFAVITYSSGAEAVLPMQRATDANKAAARAAIEAIDDAGGTCISCGIETASVEVTHSPVVDGVRRMLLISDGQANEGVFDRDELVALATARASRGVSISTIGVGLDFDERALRRLAEVGRGNYDFVEDTVALSTMFARELGSLAETIAADVRLRVAPGAGVRIEDVYGYPVTRAGDDAIVPIADLRAGETRKVVLRVAVAAGEGAPRSLASFVLDWRRVADDAGRTAHAKAEVFVDGDAAAVAASEDPAAVQVIEQARSARALEDAATAYERDGIDGARAVLERRANEVRARAAVIGRDKADELEAVSRGAMDDFARAPAKAKKAASVKAYKLAR